MVARTPRTADKTVTPRCERRWVRAAGGGRCGRGEGGEGGGGGGGGGKWRRPTVARAGAVASAGAVAQAGWWRWAGGSTSANSIPVSLGSRARAHWLPAAAVDQFGEALAVTGTCGPDGIGGRIGITDGGGARSDSLPRGARRPAGNPGVPRA